MDLILDDGWLNLQVFVETEIGRDFATRRRREFEVNFRRNKIEA